MFTAQNTRPSLPMPLATIDQILDATVSAFNDHKHPRFNYILSMSLDNLLSQDEQYTESNPYSLYRKMAITLCAERDPDRTRELFSLSEKALKDITSQRDTSLKSGNEKSLQVLKEIKAQLNDVRRAVPEKYQESFQPPHIVDKGISINKGPVRGSKPFTYADQVAKIDANNLRDRMGGSAKPADKAPLKPRAAKKKVSETFDAQAQGNTPTVIPLRNLQYLDILQYVTSAYQTITGVGITQKNETLPDPKDRQKLVRNIGIYIALKALPEETFTLNDVGQNQDRITASLFDGFNQAAGMIKDNDPIAKEIIDRAIKRFNFLPSQVLALYSGDTKARFKTWERIGLPPQRAANATAVDRTLDMDKVTQGVLNSFQKMTGIPHTKADIVTQKQYSQEQSYLKNLVIYCSTRLLPSKDYSDNVIADYMDKPLDHVRPSIKVIADNLRTNDEGTKQLMKFLAAELNVSEYQEMLLLNPGIRRAKTWDNMQSMVDAQPGEQPTPPGAA